MKNVSDTIETLDPIETIGAASSVESDVNEALSSVELTSAESEELVSETAKEWPEGGVDSFTNHALPALLFGMLGIFIVLGLIALATMGLNKLFPGQKDK